MRTIIVIFTERKLSLIEMVPYKRYKFLCNYDQEEKGYLQTVFEDGKLVKEWTLDQRIVTLSMTSFNFLMESLTLS